jgi:hypothetical protein
VLVLGCSSVTVIGGGGIGKRRRVFIPSEDVSAEVDEEVETESEAVDVEGCGHEAEGRGGSTGGRAAVWREYKRARVLGSGCLRTEPYCWSNASRVWNAFPRSPVSYPCSVRQIELEKDH